MKGGKKGLGIIKTRIKSSNVIIFLLVILDQTINVIIKNYDGVKIPLVNNILYFMPTLNTNYSWINSLFEFGLSKVFHIVLAIVILLFSYYGFKYLNFKGIKSKPINMTKIFLFSGGISSLIDKAYWNGSWDFIFLKGFFVFDLKDLYLNVFIFGIIILYIKNIKAFSKVKEVELLKDFIKFIKRDLFNIETIEK